jgi:hypothetical protein
MKIVLFKDAKGSVPVRDFLDGVFRRDKRAWAKALVFIECLQEEGYRLRRPICDYLRDGIFELRPSFGGVNYRILYFFHEDKAAILAHGLAKEGRIPEKDIDLAIMRKSIFLTDPDGYSDEADQRK